MHVHEVLASQSLSDISKYLGRWFLFLFFLTLQRIKAHGLVRTERIDVSAWIHEASMRDGRSVVNDLVQGILFLGLGCVEDVDESICA